MMLAVISEPGGKYPARYAIDTASDASDKTRKQSVYR